MKTLLLLLSSLALTSTGFSQTDSDRRFTNWDKNKDGKLAKEELPQPLQKNFARVDTDKDGFISPAEHQAMVKRRGQNRPERPGGPAGDFEKLTDLDYAGNDNPKQKLDLYLPEERGKEALPVVCWIHGGGWKNGDKRNGMKVARLAATGKYAGVSIGYRLSGEAQWPAQIHDCKAAIRWIRANAEKYKLDPDRIAIWGSSAGGHLVAMLGVSHGVADLEGKIGPHTDQSSEVKCVIDFFGPTNFLTLNDYPSRIDHYAANSPESMLLGGRVEENKGRARNASPVTHVTKDDAPMLLVHGTKDPLVAHAQSVELEKALEEAGVSATLVTVQDGGHGAGFGPTIQELVEEFLAIHLLGSDAAIKDQTVHAGQ